MLVWQRLREILDRHGRAALVTVAATRDPAVSQLTLVMHGADDTVEQIIKQTRKLVDVIEVSHPATAAP